MEVLLTGKVSCVTQEFLDTAFPRAHVIIADDGEQYLKRNKMITYYPFSVLDKRMRDLFQSHSFDKIVYFSEYLELHGAPYGELEKLRALLRVCQEGGVDLDDNPTKIMYITPQDALFEESGSNAVVLRACEELCEYYTAKRRLSIKIVRSPYLLQNEDPKGYLNRLFEEMMQTKTVTITERQEQICSFIGMNDLGDFLYRLMDFWENDTQIVNLPPAKIHTFGEFGEALKALEPGVQVRYTGETKNYIREVSSQTARQQYGWFAGTDMLEELPDLYSYYRAWIQKPKSRGAAIREYLTTHRFIICAIELIIGFFCVEGFNRLMLTTIQFDFVDLRLAFIVIMASIYGVNAGIAAAVLEGLSIVLAYRATGMTWQVLFYEPSNWLVFLWYFVVGAVCGYIRDKKDSEIAFARNEKKLLQEKFLYLNQVYEDSIRHRSQYRKQIIGFRDSFGKIFQVTKRLDKVLPDHICEEALAVLEEILENKTVALYTISRDNRYARLNVASHPLYGRIPKTLPMDSFSLALPALKKDEVWRNVQMLEGYPTYLAGVRKDGEVKALIAVYKTEYDQMGMYYANLIRILCGLIQISLYRAVEYNDALRSVQYEDNQMVVHWDTFRKIWEIRLDMQRKGITDLTVLRVTDGEIIDSSELKCLDDMIRDTDILGRGDRGELFLMLGQLGDENLAVVLKRLSATGLNFEKIEESKKVTEKLQEEI